MDRKIPIAVQVYGLRDLLEEHPENFRNVMQKIKDYGYDGVELAGLYGLKPAEVGKLNPTRDVPSLDRRYVFVSIEDRL